MANPRETAKQTIQTPLGDKTIYKLSTLGEQVNKLPYSIKVLLEAVLRNVDEYVYTSEHVKALANYDAKNVGEVEIPFMPGRVVLQDFTGVPCIVDLATMREAVADLGGDPRKVNPLSPAEMVIDHSVIV